jgi:hypothetical protein
MITRSINTLIAAALAAGVILFSALNAADARNAGASGNKGVSAPRASNINSTAASTAKTNRNPGRYQLKLNEARKLFKE